MNKLLPRFSKLSIVAILVSGIFLLDGCAPKPGCGNKRDHRRRKKSVKRFAPSMSYGYVVPVKNAYYWG